MLVASVTEPRLIKVSEAAEFLNLGRNTVYIAAREGRIPHYKIGDSVRFDLDELRAWLQENRRGPKVEAADG
jgi:putative molybdopterin biosynthesis protein